MSPNKIQCVRFVGAGRVSARLLLSLIGLASAQCGGAGVGTHTSGAPEGSVVGQQAPDLELAGLGGAKAVRLHDLRGKVLLVDVWASWCAPCKEELPMLDDMAGRLSGKGIQIVAVSIDESRDDAEAFLKSRPSWSITLANDPEGKTLGIMQPPKMPSSFIVDGTGVIREVNAGFTRGDAEKMEKRLIEVAEGASSKDGTDSAKTDASGGADSASNAPAPSKASPRPTLTGSGLIDGQPFAPKSARLVGRQGGQVVLILSGQADCSTLSPPTPGDASLTLTVPWKEGYQGDLASLKRPATFTRVSGPKKKQVSKTFKPTGTLKILAAPVAQNAVGKVAIDLTSGDYTLSGEMDVRVCVAIK